MEKSSKSISTLVVTIIAIIIITIISGGIFTYKYLVRRNKQVIQREQSQNINQNKTDVIIKKIIIPTGIDFSKPAQYYPFDIKTNKGHYLLYLSDLKKLIYDGNTIYSGSPTDYQLSNNGLHYIYSTKNENSDNIYIDGKKIRSGINMGNPISQSFEIYSFNN